MSYELYKHRLDHILEVVHSSGFSGLEAETCMLGAYYDAPGRFGEDLAKNKLQLAALTLALPWRHPVETEEELAAAERLFDYMRHFPQTKLVLVQLPWPDRNNLYERQKQTLVHIRSVARRAADRGVVCALHPNSPPGSLFRTADDYEVMFDGLDPAYCGYAPDSGHIASGGMNPYEMFRQQLPNIRHAHFKDLSAGGSWKPMGEGNIDHRAIVKLLKDHDYDGWIMVEEESGQAETDPDGVTRHNGRYVNNQLKPIVE